MAIANITGNILTDSGVATSSLLPLSGGTLTGPLNGTSANFSGKVGINATIASWMNAYSAMQLGALTAIWNSDVNFSGYGNNLYYDGSQYRYLTSTLASKFELGLGYFTWAGSPTGTAGNVATINEFMRLDASGNLGINTAAGIGSRLQVNGNVAIGFTSSTAAPTNGLAVSGAATFSSSVTATSGNFTVDDAATNSVLDILTLTHTTSGTAASGLGAGILFRAERPSSGIVLNRGAIYGVSGTDPDDNGDLAFYTLTNTGASGFSEKMRIKGSGNVGIGTSSPNRALEILSTSTQLRLSYDASVFSEIRSDSSGGLLISAANSYIINYTNGTERMRITSGGIINTTSRLNVNGAGDNSLFSLNTNGTLYTLGFSPNASASTSTTLTITTATTTWIYNGTGTATWTLPNPSGTNQMFWIKNAGTGVLTLNAFSGTNIINNSATAVSSITIAVGATALIQQDGNVRSYQLQ
jgi:hypothetical protein